MIIDLPKAHVREIIRTLRQTARDTEKAGVEPWVENREDTACWKVADRLAAALALEEAKRPKKT